MWSSFERGVDVDHRGCVRLGELTAVPFESMATDGGEPARSAQTSDGTMAMASEGMRWRARVGDQGRRLKGTRNNTR